MDLGSLTTFTISHPSFIPQEIDDILEVASIGPHCAMFFLRHDESGDFDVGACTEYGLTWLLTRAEGNDCGSWDRYLRTLFHVYYMSFLRDLKIDHEWMDQCAYSPQLDAFWDFLEW